MRLIAQTTLEIKGDSELLLIIGIVLGAMFIVCSIAYFILARYPEAEKKVSRMTWGDDADLEVYNRSGRWM